MYCLKLNIVNLKTKHAKTSEHYKAEMNVLYGYTLMK